MCLCMVGGGMVHCVLVYHVCLVDVGGGGMVGSDWCMYHVFMCCNLVFIGSLSSCV